MDRVLSSEVIDEVLKVRLPITKDWQKCSFILPDGRYFRMYEHYEAFKFLVIEGLVSCIPDAENLLSDLGYIRYSWIGYLTLPDKEPTSKQYESLEMTLIQISKYRDSISAQIHNQPKFYINYSLDDIPNIISRIKLFYKNGSLLP